MALVILVSALVQDLKKFSTRTKSDLDYVQCAQVVERRPEEDPPKYLTVPGILSHYNYIRL